MAITDGYVIMQGGYYLAEDMSGPYAIGSDGSVTLIGSDGGGGSGGGQTDGLTDAQLRASPVPVTGGGLTDDQLRASPVPVTGGLTDAQLRASAIPVTGALTDAQLRASALTVTGGLTNAQLRAAPIETVPSMSSGGNVTVNVTSTAAALPDHPARQITICNSSETDITVTQDGNPLVVIARSYFTFSGVSNTNQLSLESTTDETVYVRWVA